MEEQQHGRCVSLGNDRHVEHVGALKRGHEASRVAAKAIANVGDHMVHWQTLVA